MFFRRVVQVALFAPLVGFVASQTIPTDIPATELACLLTCASQIGCASTDITCLCANAGPLATCAISNCGATQAQANEVLAEYCPGQSLSSSSAPAPAPPSTTAPPPAPPPATSSTPVPAPPPSSVPPIPTTIPSVTLSTVTYPPNNATTSASATIPTTSSMPTFTGSATQNSPVYAIVVALAGVIARLLHLDLF